MNSKKIKIIVNWITSINLKEMQNFVKFANFDRQFIKKFLKIIQFLMKLTRKSRFFVWNKTYFKAFQEFKNWIIFVFILHHFNSKKQTILKTDFFDWMINNVLLQHDNNAILHSMTFYNKNLNFVEINYYIYNKNYWLLFSVLNIDVLNLFTRNFSSKFLSIITY